MVFCYVILHYKTEKDTIKCIRSIFDSDQESLVVVVDNASKNGSIEKVEQVFAGHNRVYIVKSEENLGFAAGNNIGYRYARDELLADFIAVSNNDIIVVTKGLPTLVCELYKNFPFFVMGPDIISEVDGGHQNPIDEPFHSRWEVYMEIIRYRILLFLSRIGVYDIVRPNRKVRTGSTKRIIPCEPTKNVALHGSFVVFAPSFVKKEALSFREGTFLYVEEAILKRYCDSQKYTMIFDPRIVVHHKEDASTNSLNLTNRERREFVFRNMIHSLGTYLGYF